MTFSTLHIFCCKIFSRPRLPKMTLNLFWSLHPNHLFTTLPHLLFGCNSLYSTSLSYFHFHFQQIQLYCLSSTFTFNLLIFLKWVVAPQPTKHLQCRLHFAMQGVNCDILAFLYTLRHHFQVPLMVSSSQVSNMFATVICKLVCICVKVTLIDQFTSSTLYMVRFLPSPKGLILALR